jgi:hypothetical protein
MIGESDDEGEGHKDAGNKETQPAEVCGEHPVALMKNMDRDADVII